MNSVVLDASAILAFVKGEAGADVVAPHIAGGMISAVNYSEVLKKAIEHDGSVAITSALMERAQIQIIPFDAIQAKCAAELWPTSREHGLSLGDRACLALGITLNKPVLTADRRMAKLKLSIKITSIRTGN